MNERNLPVKVVLPRHRDIKRNTGGGGLKYFCEVNDTLKKEMVVKLEGLLKFYENDFIENQNMPAVGKVVVRDEAIAKSHKPSELFRECDIIGAGNLNELIIKVTKDSLIKTIDLVNKVPSQKIEANMTTIQDILPISYQSKISDRLSKLTEDSSFEIGEENLIVNLYEFSNEYDDTIVQENIEKKLSLIPSVKEYKIVEFKSGSKFITLSLDDVCGINEVSKINGIKKIDVMQSYSIKESSLFKNQSAELLLDDENKSDIIIGIIDGGITKKHKYLDQFVVERIEYVPSDYQNNQHATFIASMIQYGDSLNNLPSANNKKFKFLDVVAIPNGDKDFGPTEAINEIDLMSIIEEVVATKSGEVKIWNLSLGIEAFICDGNISNLGIFCDNIQRTYDVQFVISSGNLRHAPLRTWPPQNHIGERDRIISPADSVRAITVGSIALHDSDSSIVGVNEPSPFSRRGPGPGYVIKPDVVDYGGNTHHDFSFKNIGVKGMNEDGEIIEGIGTSYAAPRIAKKVADIYDELAEKDLLLAKAMLIHSAKLNSRNLYSTSQDEIKYYGFGLPSCNSYDVLQCSNDEVTLIFKQKIIEGTFLEMLEFPYPKSLVRNNKYFGEIVMTLAYDPILDHNFGSEYCRSNIDVSFGTYNITEDGNYDFKGQVPLEKRWDQRHEKSLVENGFKWSPIKSYYRNIKRGLDLASGWKIRVDLTNRHGLIQPEQEFVLIITFKDPLGTDIYSDIVNGLRENGYPTQNLEIRQQVRQRNNV